MLQLLQQDLRSKSMRSRSERAHGAEVAVGECLGSGGFGAVFRGTWHRVPVAVKVMPARHSEQQAMQDAVEMAVLSSVQHPNIVTVYSCLTDMVETAGARGGPRRGCLRACACACACAASLFCWLLLLLSLSTLAHKFLTLPALPSPRRGALHEHEREHRPADLLPPRRPRRGPRRQHDDVQPDHHGGERLGYISRGFLGWKMGFGWKGFCPVQG
jgi:hypothetical protein